MAEARPPLPIMAEMPSEVKNTIIEFLGAEDKINVNLVNRELMGLIEKTPMKFHAVRVCISAKRVELKMMDSEDSDGFNILWEHVDDIASYNYSTLIRRYRRLAITEKIHKNTDFLYSAAAGIAAILARKKLTIDNLSINNLSYLGSTRDAFFAELAAQLQRHRTTKIHVKNFFMTINDVESAQLILDVLEPSKIEALKLPIINASHPSREPLTSLGNSALFLNASKIYIEELNASIPVEHWRDKAMVHIRVGEVGIAFIVALKEYLLTSPAFERFQIVHQFIEISEMRRALHQHTNTRIDDRPIGGKMSTTISFARVVFERVGAPPDHRFIIV